MGARLDLANLSGASLLRANIEGATFSGANLNGATGLSRALGVASYSPSTDFAGTDFDPEAAGWTLVEDPPEPVATSALLTVPEPTIGLLLLVGGGLALLLPARRKKD